MTAATDLLRSAASAMRAHVAEAERLVNLATDGGAEDVGDWSPDAADLLAAAQVHATLAVALKEQP